MKFRQYPCDNLKGSDWVCYQRKGDPYHYVLYPGDTAIVDPQGKSRRAESHRGRVCQVLSTMVNMNGTLKVKYLDTGKTGRVLAHDLIPQPQVLEFPA